MGSLPYGKSLLPRPFALLAGLLIVAAAAGAGWFAASQLTSNSEPSTATPAPSVSVRSGPAQLQLRAGWTPDAKVLTVPGLVGADAKSLAPADGGRGRMVVALVKGETADLPADLSSALRVPLPKPEHPRIGGMRGNGYPALSLRGVNGLTDLYTFHTSAGLLTIACIAPLDDPLPAGSCPADVTAIGIKTDPPADPTAKLKAAMPKIAADLNTARTSSRLALSRSADSSSQARAARSLESAYGKAATAAAAVAPSGARLPEAFQDASSAYRSLALAADARDEKAWALARVTVDAAEREAAAQLVALSG